MTILPNIPCRLHCKLKGFHHLPFLPPASKASSAESLSVNVVDELAESTHVDANLDVDQDVNTKSDEIK